MVSFSHKTGCPLYWTMLWSLICAAICLNVSARIAIPVATSSVSAAFALHQTPRFTAIYNANTGSFRCRRVLHQSQQDSSNSGSSQQPTSSSNSVDNSNNSGGSSGAVPTTTSGGVSVPITSGLAGSTIIVYTQPLGGIPPGGSATSQNPSNPIRVLICPGTPGCPENINTSSSATAASPSPGSAETTSTSSSVSRWDPVTPTALKPEERVPVPPGDLDLSRLKRPDTVAATMLLKDTTPEDFVSKYGMTFDNITANITGTPAFVRNITVFTQQQQQGSRRLLLQQQGQQFINVTLSLLTSNPLLVWFRLITTTADGTTPNQGNLPNSMSSNCNTIYCQQLTAAGIPIGSDIWVTPDYVTLLTAPAAAAAGTRAPDAAATAATADAGNAANVLLEEVGSNRETIDFIRRLAAGVATGVVGLLFVAVILWKRKSLKKCLGCAAVGPNGSKTKPAETGSRKSKKQLPALPATASNSAEATTTMVVSDVAGSGQNSLGDEVNADQDKSKDVVTEQKKPLSRSQPRSSRRKVQQKQNLDSLQVTRGSSPEPASPESDLKGGSINLPTSPRSSVKGSTPSHALVMTRSAVVLSPGSNVTISRSAGVQTHQAMQRAGAGAKDIPIPNLPPWPNTPPINNSIEISKFKAAAAAAAMRPITSSQPSSPRSVASRSTTGSTAETDIAESKIADKSKGKQVQKAARAAPPAAEAADEFVSDSGTVITIQSSIAAGVSAATSAALAAAVLRNK